MEQIVVSDLAFRFSADTPEVLSACTMRLNARGLTLVVGANGSGKSVFLKLLVGLLRPTRGTIHYDDLPLTAPLPARVGYLFQHSHRQILGFSVEDDIGLAFAGRGITTGQRAAAVERIAKVLGVDGYLKRHPAELSGGQLRRVALAGTMVHNPELLLLDEPLQELDYRATGMLLAQLVERRAQGRGTVIATHETRGLWEMCDEVIILEEGALLYSGEKKGALTHLTPLHGLAGIGGDA